MIPSFEKLIAIIVSAFIGLHVIGRRDLIWKAVAYMQYEAMHSASKPWGCPSAFNKGACKGYDPSRYK